MSEHAPDRLWSGIDVPKTIAGVLAAVTAAVIGSFLGAAGTLAGAAIASVVGSVGTEIYRKLVHRGQQKIVSTFVAAPAAVGTPAVAAAADESPSEASPASASEADAETPSGSAGTTLVASRRKMRWGRVAMVAASVFVLAIGVLTAFEAVTGKTAADAVTGGHSDSRTSVGAAFSGHHKKGDQSSTPAPTPSSSAPASVAPSEAPTGSEAPTTEPATTDTTTPSAPSTPTETATPEPTATDTRNSDGGDGGQHNIAPPATPQPQETE